MSEAGSPIAVIGAGFSGTMTALHLMASVPGRRILLCERGPTFARGAAYSTDDPVHLLNVRAGSMSAFPERLDDFLAWLSGQTDLPPDHIHETAAGTFVSRSIYGRYLSGLLQNELACPEGASRLRIVPDEVVGLARRADDGFDMVLAGGRSHRVAGAVVAVGNLTASDDREPGPIVRDPWAVRFTDGLAEGRPVVVVGTGLTMVDVVTSLFRSGFAGPVLAISRRGLLPRSHVAPSPWVLSRFDPQRGEPLSALLRAFRDEVRGAAAKGLPWQSVMDAVRPMTTRLWRALDAGQQARFIRHLRPWWDVHRHRMSPPVGRLLRSLIERGYLRVSAGQLRSMAGEDGSGATVRWTPRGQADGETITAQRIIYATGSPSMTVVRDTLLDGLLRSGLVRVDRHGLGLEAGADLQLVGQDGQATPRLWGIGPIVRGSFWECTAVPDIRTDAQRLADRVAHALSG